MFTVDSLLALLVGMILVPLVIYLPLYMQGVLGKTATTSGAAITPMTAAIVVGSTLTGFAIARVGRYRLITIAGALLLAAGVFLMTQMTPSTSLGMASMALILAGVGLGTFFGMLTLVAQNSLPRKRKGAGIGAITYLRSVGQAIGLAGIGTVITGSLRNDLPGRLPIEAANFLTPEGLKAATDTHLLVDPAFRASVVRAVENLAAANVPNGPSARSCFPPGPAARCASLRRAEAVACICPAARISGGARFLRDFARGVILPSRRSALEILGRNRVRGG